MKNQALTTSASQPLNGKGISLLTFRVAGQTYGIVISNVVRIIEMVTITALPGAPDTIQGIINVHGKAVPIIDLRCRFESPQVTYGLHTPIILVQVDNSRTLGLVVDSVDQVLDAPAESMEKTETIMPPELTSPMTSEAGYLASVAKVDRRMILVLDVKALLTRQDRLQLSQALQRQGIAGTSKIQNG